MDTPIAAILGTEDSRRDVAAILRMLAHLETACLDMGAEEAATHIAQAAAALLGATGARRFAA